MKIHGTAKGGALSTKDFGVAFGGAVAPVVWMSTIDFTPAATQALSVSYPSRGEGAVNSSSAIIGNVIGTVKCRLYLPSGTSAIGSIYCEVRKMSDNSLLYSIGTNTELITTTPTEFTFTGGVGYTMIEDATICLRGNNALIRYKSNGAQAYDGGNSGRTYVNTSGVWDVKDYEDWLALFSSEIN